MMVLGERVLEVAARQGAERVTAIHLRVGTLASVDAEALRTAAAIVLVGTCAQNARLSIEEVAAAWGCAVCGREHGSEDGPCPCPHCGHPTPGLLRGRELQLHALDLEP